MAWDDVPEKMVSYVTEKYADDNAGFKLLAYYDAKTLADVLVHRREEFETDLDYRLGACINLRNSVAVRPKR